MSGTGITQGLVVTVHGDAGPLDLVVPPGATAAQLAGEYAARHGLATAPALVTRAGRALAPDRGLDVLGVETGDVLVACAPGPAGGARPEEAAPRRTPETWPLGAWLWAGTAAGFAVLGGLLAAGAGEGLRVAAAVALGLGALVAVLPLGRCLEQRRAVAPALGGAAAYVVVAADPTAGSALVVAVVALVAAGTAGLGRALADRDTEVLDVTIAAGLGVVVVTGGCVLLDAPSALPWALLLVVAVLLGRFAPGLVVDVPDEQLIDLERLAVTAWSARERAGGKRTRVVIAPGAVRDLLDRASRLLGATAAVTLVLVVVAAPLLLHATAGSDLDRLGSRLLLGFGAAALLLGARNHRHAVARVLLRLAGLALTGAVLVDVLSTAGGGLRWWLALVSIAAGVAVCVAAVATGRGWRSAWWSRKAEVAETLCGALAVASVVIASGAFRMLWE